MEVSHQASSDVAAFAAIDLSPSPEDFIRFLEVLNSLPYYQQLKQTSCDLLRVRPGDRLLDVGCGLGDVVASLAEQVGSEGRVVGIDASETMLGEAARRLGWRGLPVDLRRADAQSLPFADDTFDGCRADRVLTFVDDPLQALAEMARVTRPGRWVAASDPDWETVVVDAPDSALTRRILNFWCDGVRHGWMGRRLPGLFRQAGLEEVQIVPSTLVLTDLPTVRDAYLLGRTVEQARQQRVVSEDDARRWWSMLEEQWAAGRFFFAATFFTVAGRKAAPGS